jgi:hypothetical protein
VLTPPTTGITITVPTTQATTTTVP